MFQGICNNVFIVAFIIDNNIINREVVIDK